MAAKAFSSDAEKLAGQGYSVVLQSWEAGKTGWLRFVLTLTLSRWLFKPDGSLTVTYRLERASNAPQVQS
jgi:hypothetical protein